MFLTSDPNDEHELTTAVEDKGYKCFNLPIYDDGWGELFVFGHEYGPTRVIRARTWENAWEIAIDEERTISTDGEVLEAYGLYIVEHSKLFYLCLDTNFHDDAGHDKFFEEWRATHRVLNAYRAHHDAISDGLEYIREEELELIEGYEYQSNCTGTGIVNLGHYAWLDSLEDYNQARQVDFWSYDKITPVFTWT